MRLATVTYRVFSITYPRPVDTVKTLETHIYF